MFKSIKKGTIENNYLLEISEKFESNEIICKDILTMLDNNKTNIVFDKELKGNYYVFLKDTIYLSDKQSKKTGYERICIIAHECIHSIQNKVLQYINFILSNLEFLVFILSIVLIFLKVKSNYVFNTYLIVSIICVIPRLILEIHAIVNSYILSRKYISKTLNETETNALLKVYKFTLITTFPLFLIDLIYLKVIRVLVVLLLINVV